VALMASLYPTRGRTLDAHGRIAQLGEHGPYKAESATEPAGRSQIYRRFLSSRWLALARFGSVVGGHGHVFGHVKCT
jgi:hypothetical protein